MPGVNSLHKMFRWLKDKKKNKQERKTRNVDDDYGFKKKQIILQETENGHSVIIKDSETTLVYPQSFCRLNYRARMPTPVQNVKETSTHIYDEIPEIAVRTRLQLDSNQNEADIIKDTRSSRNYPMDFKNAIEVGPYLIVPIVNSSETKGDVEIFKRNENVPSTNINCVPPAKGCHCQVNTPCTCNSKEPHSPPWDSNASSHNRDVIRDTKVVLTRCVKSKNSTLSMDNIQPMCSFPEKCESNACSLINSACHSDTDSPTLTEISDSRSLVETPDESSERSESCAIATKEDNSENSEQKHPGGNETCCEYDLRTSEENDKSAASDYELYLSKIENNLKLKQDVRKMADNIEFTISDNEAEPPSGITGDENDTMTYVSSLSEYSSAASHISDISADCSASDDSSGYYECSEEVTESRDRKRDGRVNLERSVSAPETGISSIKSKKNKDKVHKSKKYSTNLRSQSFDHKVNGFSSSEEKEVYKFPSSKNSSSKNAGSRQSRGKAVLAPQPTPVYMDPYRGESRSHNRLLGDLIRMNYDKQLFTH